jgi:hypothetical protein
MKRINILNKCGMLSDEDRKQPLERAGMRFKFKTNIDLSVPIEVTPIGNYKECSLHHYSQDIANFISWWTDNVSHHLNGFSGFHQVKFVPIGFTIV